MIILLVIDQRLVYAQDITSGESMSIEECVEYAIKNNVSAKDKVINKQIFNTRVKEYLAGAFPEIKFNTSVANNLILRKSIIDTSTFGPAGTPKNEVPVAFGLQYVGDAGVTLKQMIVNSSFFVGLIAAKTYKNLAEVDLDRTSVVVREQIINAYLGVLISKERIALLKANETRLIKLIDETKNLQQQGFAALSDVNRLMISKSNVSATLRKSIIGLQISKDMLYLQMGLPYGEKITLSSTLEYVSDKLKLPNFDDYKHEKSKDFKYLKVQKELAVLSYKEQQYSRVPSIYLNGSYGYNTGTNEFSQFFQGDRWFDNASLSISLNVPIFAGFKKSYSAQIKRLTIKQVENQIDNFEKKTSASIKNKLAEYQLLLKNLEEYKKNQDMAKEIFENSNIKFKEGVGSNLEIIEAQTSFREAQTNYFSALYDVLVTKVTLNKLYGNLNEGF